MKKPFNLTPDPDPKEAKPRPNRNAYAREYRKNNPDKLRAVESRRIRKPEEWDRRRKRDSKRWKELGLKKNTRNSRDITKARTARQTRTAIANGTLVRPETCQECGMKRKIDAHHTDYTKPLEIQWLCRPCHMRHHRKHPGVAETLSFDWGDEEQIG